MTPEQTSILDRRENGGDRREPPDMPVAPRSWMREQLTLPNVVILATACIGVGGYLQILRDHDTRIARLEVARTVDEQTYQRKEIQAEQLRLIEWRLAGLERTTARIEASVAAGRKER